MIDEEDERRVRSPALMELGREDLERLSREELALRIELLEAEKARTRAALAAKADLHGAAASLFKR